MVNDPYIGHSVTWL